MMLLADSGGALGSIIFAILMVVITLLQSYQQARKRKKLEENPDFLDELDVQYLDPQLAGKLEQKEWSIGEVSPAWEPPKVPQNLPPVPAQKVSPVRPVQPKQPTKPKKIRLKNREVYRALRCRKQAKLAIVTKEVLDRPRAFDI